MSSKGLATPVPIRSESPIIEDQLPFLSFELRTDVDPNLNLKVRGIAQSYVLHCYEFSFMVVFQLSWYVRVLGCRFLVSREDLM